MIDATADGAARPIFLIGTGRCGSSLLLRLLGNHPDLAWMSHYSTRLPGGGRWAALARVHRLPGLSGWLPNPRSKLVPQPTESYTLLRAATDHLFTAPRELTADEATPDIIRRLRAMASEHVAAQGAERFLMKHTGFPRVDFLRRAFPDARFIHVVRDGRAVATSLCKVDWWAGEAGWGWGPLTDAQRRAYAASGYHEVVLAGLYWSALMRRYAEVRDRTPPSSLLEVRYDALVADPRRVVGDIARFAGLRDDPTFDRRVRAIAMTSDDTRWRRALTDDERRALEDVIGDDLRAWGFDAPEAQP